MKHIIIILAFLMTLSSPVAAQDYQKGLAAVRAGDFATALQEWTPLADAGDADAQYILGLVYNRGEGVTRDYAEAAKWLRSLLNKVTLKLNSDLVICTPMA